MSAIQKTWRACLAAAVTATAVLASLVLVPAPAGAVSYQGDLLAKGPGSAYTQGGAVSLSGSEGATVTFTFQVKNTGTTLAQFKVEIVDYSQAEAQLYDGSLALRPLTTSGGYFTNPIAGGSAQVLTLKVKIPIDDPDYEHITAVVLYSNDGVTVLDYLSLVAEQAVPTSGTVPNDMFVKVGFQAPVGGQQGYQYMTAPTLSATGTATFNVTLKNSSAPSIRINFSVTDAACGHTLTVKDGSLNVTAAALAGTYQTPTLAQGAKRSLTVTMKSSAFVCPGAVFEARSDVPGYPTQVVNMLVNKAA